MKDVIIFIIIVIILLVGGFVLFMEKSRHDRLSIIDLTNNLVYSIRAENFIKSKADIKKILKLHPSKHLAKQLTIAEMDIDDGNVYDSQVDVKNIKSYIYNHYQINNKK